MLDEIVAELAKERRSLVVYVSHDSCYDDARCYGIMQDVAHLEA